MNLRISRERFWFLLRIALPIAGLIVLFFSGIFPLENLLTVAPQDLTASVAASDVASLTNQDRIADGLPPLAVSPLLTEAAQLKADDMAKYSYYAHTGPDGKTMLDWMNEVGYRYLNAGENLVIDRTTAQEAVDAWMNSPDHRANILRPQFTQIGVGVSEGVYQGIPTIYVVQEFGTPYPTSAMLPTVAKAAAPAAPVPVPTPVIEVPKVPAPAAIPHLVSLASKPAAASAAPSAAAPAASSSMGTASAAEGQGTNTVSFALAPEFYAPVTLTPRQNAQDAARPEAPQGTSISRISVWIDQIRAYLSHIF